MYGLPEGFDLSFLKGKEITGICFAAYQVNVHFEANIWIQIEGRYRIVRGDDTLEAIEKFPVLGSVFPQLIGMRPVDVTFTPSSGDIEIHLENGLGLQVDGHVGPYEAYRLFDGKTETIV